MTDRPSPPGAPPLFLQLAAHPVRWGLLVELSSSDRRVRELCVTVGKPQNVVSYHLGRLRAGGLVSARRSSADGRDSYYRVDMTRCAELLGQAANALHPALRPDAAGPPLRPVARRRRRRGRDETVRVLFLCTGNSARSQMAEALLAVRGGERVAAFSAGSHPKPINPLAVRVMRDYGVDLSGARSKPLSLFTAQRFDHVISLCDRVREVCPEFPGRPMTSHWSIADPAAAGDDRAVRAATVGVANDLSERIDLLLARILPTAA